MIIRSWLFVPGDSERKLVKGRENPADAGPSVQALRWPSSPFHY